MEVLIGKILGIPAGAITEDDEGRWMRLGDTGSRLWETHWASAPEFQPWALRIWTSNYDTGCSEVAAFEELANSEGSHK